MKMRRGAALGALALSVVGMVAAYRLGRARADGVPMVNPLYYGGMLDDGGRPVEGTRNVTVRLWDAASAGATVCTTNAGATAFSGGRFRVALDSGCVGAVRANPELWAELQVEGTVFPRAKLGAVPYALEAGRATGAAGALEARLAAVEGRPTGGRQVVIGSWRPTTPGGTESIAVPCPVPANTTEVTVPLTQAPFSITFTAMATAFYRVYQSADGSTIDPGTGAVGGYPIDITVSPVVAPTFRHNNEAMYPLEAGRAYRFSLGVRLPPDCRSSHIMLARPFIVEQFN